ncbi:MAG: hypothetical protein Q7V63_04880 [Gammaproteobacteria bacterium]|nr:hypothetical protein [Gammaproteobacteria bacterium]
MKDKVHKKVEEYFRVGNSKSVKGYLRTQLMMRSITAHELLVYIENTKITSMLGKPDVMSADEIAELGAVVSKLVDAEQSKLSIEFYRVAAERDSISGCLHYAEALYLQNKSHDALAAIKIVRDLCKSDDAKNDTSLLYAKILRKNKQWVQANQAMLDYYQLKLQMQQEPLSEAAQEKIANEIQEVLTLFNEVHEEFFYELKETGPSKTICTLLLEELLPFIECKAYLDFHQPAFEAIRKTSFLIQGQCYEFLRAYDKAMHAYLEVDKAHAHYSAAVSGMGRVIKAKIKQDLLIDSSSREKSSSVEASGSSVLKKRSRREFSMPGVIARPVRFSAAWKSEQAWFDSVDTAKLAAENEKSSVQLDRLLAAKNAELARVDKALPEEDLFAKKHTLNADVKAIKSAQKDLEAMYASVMPEDRAESRRHHAERCFFDPARSIKKDQIAKLACQIVDQRYRTLADSFTPIDLSGISARVFITAENAYLKAVSSLKGDGEVRLGIPVAREAPWRINHHSGVTHYGPIETYKIGATSVTAEHRADPKAVRRGDSYMAQHGTYDEMYKQLLKLTSGKPDIEKALASYMIRYGKNHQVISLDELKALYPKANGTDVEKFNRFCFLILTKEQMQWHSAESKPYHLGMMVAQARCLILIEKGVISFEEAFKNNPLFGVYSQTKLVEKIEKVKVASKRIEDLYKEYLKTERGKDHLAFYKSHMGDTTIATVLSRQQAHEDLLHVYGGDNDTDNDGYDTDLSIEPIDKPKTKRVCKEDLFIEAEGISP